LTELTAPPQEQPPDAARSKDLSVRPNRKSMTAFVERTVDGEQEMPLQDILGKLARRKWLLAICMIVPMLISLAITLLTPMTWQASTKILIRYSSSESVFLKGLIPDDRVSLSASASSEIIRSLPTLEEVVTRYDIDKSDLYQTTPRILSDYAGQFYHLFVAEKDSTAEDKRMAIARRFQDSLQASSAVAAGKSKVAPIEVLGSTSSVPQSVKGDELLTLTVKAFNRTKVAEITNGLAQAFINQYYKISAEDARRSYEFLSLLADQLEADVQRLQQNPRDAPPTTASLSSHFTDAGISRDSPAMTTLANELATREARLGRDQQVYKYGSPEITRQMAEIENLKRLFSSQERLDIAKQAYEQIKTRRFQALNTQRLYESHLEPISIIEPAVTPPASSSAQALRLLTSALTGLLIGSVFGLAAAIVLGTLDQRLFTPLDVERWLKLPIAGWAPRFGRLTVVNDVLPIISEPTILAADDGLSHLIGLLHAEPEKGAPRVVAIGSSADDDGKSFIALLLAKAIAQDRNRKVLLIDADAAKASLSRRFDSAAAETRATSPGATLRVTPTDDPNVDLLAKPQGREQSVLDYTRWLRQSLDEARRSYDLILIDTPSFSLSGRTFICCQQAEMVLLVVKSGVSRKGPLQDFLRRLQEVSIEPQGVIMNFFERRA
jgi:Mrp family chromosome partitioning ATPase